MHKHSISATLFFVLFFVCHPCSSFERIPQSIHFAQKKQEVVIYESEATSADQCTSYEKFDDQRNVCVFECNSPQQCSKIENAINEELAAREETSPNNKEEQSPDEPIEAIYDVTPNKKISIREGEDIKLYRDIWDEIAALAPHNLFEQYLATYQIYNNKDSDNYAYVLQDSIEEQKWHFMLNVSALKESSIKEQKNTYIHEITHILTLNTSQIIPKENCITLILAEGCALPNSYIYKFFNAFWRNKGEKQKYSAQDFVEEYGAENITEDFAVTFVQYVLGKEPADSSNKIRDKKLRFMGSIPDLVEIRNAMRNTLGPSILNARN